MNLPNPTPNQRSRAYEVAIAAIAVAVIYGLVAGDAADAWLALIGAALGVARANVTQPEHPVDEGE